MEFIKAGKGKYLIKNSGGKVVSEKEKLELENKELVYEDIKSDKCQGKTTQKITKNKKKLKEIAKEEYKEMIEDLSNIETFTEEENEEHKVVEVIKEEQ